ncbi:MAG: hypothetical protein AAF368_14385 [Planctomycetota bacterium]
MRRIEKPKLPFPELEAATDELEKGHTGDDYSPSFDSSLWRSPRVLGALRASHGAACAYCQAALERRGGDVEHFRPKSTYWWLAYRFSNYFLSCLDCNRYRKSNKFPLMPGAQRLRYGDGRSEHEESCLLLDPAQGPVDRFVLRRDGVFWRVAPRIVNGVPDPQAEETIRFFKLNLEMNPYFRERALAKALDSAERARTEPGMAIEAKKRASHFAPYGVFVQRLFRQFEYGHLIPSVEEDVERLVGDLAENARVLEAALDRRDDAMTSNQFESTLWALASLAFSPPSPLTADRVRSWIPRDFKAIVSAMVQAVANEASGASSSHSPG